MGSTRLPGKVMKELLPGRTALALLLERLQRCRTLDGLVVATPEGQSDAPVRAEAERSGARVVTGSEADVLERYLTAARTVQADVVVRITSDCPLLDADLVDACVARYLAHLRHVDLLTTVFEPTFPLGLAVEVFAFDTLLRLDRLSGSAALREHVTTLAYERPEWFLIDSITDTVDRSASRWTLDYPEDLEFIRAVYAELYPLNPAFSRREIEGLLERRAELVLINCHAGRVGAGRTG
jgi:spore coat polysaccharide biosynthesis protein SpsF